MQKKGFNAKQFLADIVIAMVAVIVSVACYSIDQTGIKTYGLPGIPDIPAPHALERAESVLYDMRLKSSHEPVHEATGVVLLPIDDLAVARYGRWPWSRERWVPILETLHELGARATFFDIEFPEGSEPILPRDATGTSFEEMVERNFDGLTGLINPGSITAMLASTEARKEPTEAVLAITRVINDQLRGLREKVLSAARKPDLELAGAFKRLKDAGTFMNGVFYIEGGNSIDGGSSVIRREAYIRQLLETDAGRDLKRSPEPPRGIPAESRLTLQILRALVAEPLAAATDPVFQKVGLTVREVEHELESAREILVAAALDKVLGSDAYQPKSTAIDGVVRLLRVGSEAAISSLLRKLIDPAISRAIVRQRFLLPLKEHSWFDFPGYISFVPPIPDIAKAYSGLAVSTTVYDNDGVSRRIPLLWKVAGGFAPSPGMLLYLTSIGFSLDRTARATETIHLDQPHWIRITAKGQREVKIPVDNKGRMILRFAGTYEQALSKAPLGSVVTYLSLKQQRNEVFDATPSGPDLQRLRKYERGAQLVNWEEGDPVLTYEQLKLKCKERNLVSDLMTWDDFKEKPGAPATEADQIPTSQWLTLSRTLIDSIEKSDEKRLEKKLIKFHKKSPAEQEAERSNPDGNWTKLLNQLASIKACDPTPYRNRLQELVKGRLCIIGAGMTGNTDESPTPFDVRAPNFGLHAHGFNTLQSRRFIMRRDFNQATLIPTIVTSITLGVLLYWVGILLGGFLTIISVGAYYAFTRHLLLSNGLWVDMTLPALSMVLTYTGVTVVRYLTEEKDKNKIKGYLEAYVDKAAIQQFLDRPELWGELGGTTCEITAFFSDIEGFTPISETLTPEGLSDMLTDYLSPMTKIIHTHKGVRDKFIGDAIVAFWGAPIHYPDHAVQACMAAIEQQERLELLRKDPRLLANPNSWLNVLNRAGKNFRIRIGLNTGSAKVGNFGSLENRNYTMIGDTVNLASRLEGANKVFNTGIMISESTYLKARDHVEARALDKIRVKGKLVPVAVYELLAKKNQITPLTAQVRDAYERAFQIHLDRRFEEAMLAFKEILNVRDDPASRAMISRCQYYLEHPPGQDWDGAYDLKEK